ncbi:CarD family transcriptional regulator [Microvirga sp. VF16]|uniref:CarD family transcriptional regulator n=1 Tax=Microvirga sp. VF16 TaxID=2807101 RepID=UPI00193CF417|nr:CarD family transcriptional regulator [Microvirga sp. VF16]QRM33538.1 CarD family transcriptional regulator [Microvirga sp. VF16]
MNTKNTALSFQAGETVVYPGHGLGVITGIEGQEVAGFKLELLVLSLDAGKVTVRIPLAKAKSSGLRKLSEPAIVNQALAILSGKARAKRGMWNRRAADYQERISTGQLTAVAEVLRDLNRGPQQEEASYSERQIFEGALDFTVKEIAAVRQITETEARKLIEQGLADAPRSSKLAGSEAAA